MTTKRWIGNAAAIFDVWTISLSGTVTSQTYSVTINNKSLIYAATGTDTVSNILTALFNAWTSVSMPPPTEFQELTPVLNSSAIVVTANVAGNPCTLTVGTTGGATFTITHTQSATGPNDFANPQNWSGGVAPANADTLVFDNGSTDCKYNLSTSLTGVTLMVNPAYSGKIGLPFINTNGTTSYAEYRPTALSLAGGTAQINAPNIKRLNLAFGSNTATVSVIATGARLDQYTPVILITGGNSSSVLNISKGDVGVAYYEGQVAQFNTIQTTFLYSAQADVTLYCGPGAILSSINKNGGTLTVNSNVSSLTQGVSGGMTTIVAGAVTTMYVEGGTCYYNSTGTLGTVTIANKGALDFSQDPQEKTVTNPILVFGDSASINDPNKVVNSGTLSVTTEQTVMLNITHGSGNICQFT